MVVLKRAINKLDEDQSGKFDGMAAQFASVTRELQGVVQSTKKQEETLAEMKTKLAIHEVHSTQMQRAIEDFRALERDIIILQSRVDAAFRVIDEVKDNSHRAS